MASKLGAEWKAADRRPIILSIRLQRLPVKLAPPFEAAPFFRAGWAKSLLDRGWRPWIEFLVTGNLASLTG